MARVLIVDDEQSIRFTLGEFLRGAGYTVGLAEDVEAAMAALAAGPWDVVATDIILPGATGIDLLHWIRRTDPEIQVVVMTGEPTVDTAAEAVRAGALDYLPKPITRAAILKAVETATRVKALADERARLARENQRYQEGLELLVRERTAALEAEIDERRVAESRLRVRTEQLEAVRGTTLDIARELNPDMLTELILRRACELIGGAAGSLLFYDPKTETLVPHLRTGSLAALGETTLRLGEGISGQVAAERSGRYVNGYRQWHGASPQVLGRTPTTAYLAEPLLLREVLLGVIGIAREDGRDFTDEDQEMLRLFAAQAAIAIGNARMYRETVRHGEQLDALLRSLRNILEGPDFQSTLDRLLLEASQITGSFNVRILLLDREQQLLRPAALRGVGGMERNHVLRLGEGLSGIVAASGAPLQCENTQDDPRNLYQSRDRALGIAQYLGLPIRLHGEVVGVLAFSDKARPAYSPDEVAYLSSFADQAAVALENARLFEAAAHRADRLRMLNRLTNRLTMKLHSAEIVQEVLDAVDALLPGTVGQVWVCHADRRAMSAVASCAPGDDQSGMTQELPWGEGLVGHAVSRREPVLVDDVKTDPRFINQAWAGRHGLGAGYALPLLHQEQAEGGLVVLGRGSRRFTDEEIDLLQALAGHAAIALGRARLFRSLQEQHGQLRQLWRRLSEVEETERRRLSRELHDRVGQNLTALSLNLSILMSLIPQELAERIGSRLVDSQNILQETVACIRNVMAELRPPVLDDYGLPAALRWYATQFGARLGIPIGVWAEDLPERLDRSVETVLFRVAQESLTNVAKHAQAAQVALALEAEEARIRLSVADDGRGFDPGAQAEAGAVPRWGLLSMRERVEAIGGAFRVESAPGAGTRILVEIAR